ncbi:c-type cytochrome [Aliidiomarina sp. Khilg15.8]
MLKLRTSLLALGTATLLATSFSTVQATAFTDADKAVDYRQGAFQLMYENFSYMADMVRGDRDYDAEMFEQRAQAFHHMTYVPWDGFRHAGAEYSGDGDALPAIWEKWGDFKQNSEQLQKDAKALAAVAAEQDMNAIRDQFMSTARNCKQCHDNFRAD